MSADMDASAASSAALISPSGINVDVPVPIEPPSQPEEAEEAEDHQGEEDVQGPQDATHQVEAEAQEDAFSSASAPAPKAEKKNMNNVPLGIKRSPISGIWEPPDQRTLPCLRRGSYKERATLFTNKPILLTNTNITPATREVPAYVSPRSAPRGRERAPSKSRFVRATDTNNKEGNYLRPREELKHQARKARKKQASNPRTRVRYGTSVKLTSGRHVSRWIVQTPSLLV